MSTSATLDYVQPTQTLEDAKAVLRAERKANARQVIERAIEQCKPQVFRGLGGLDNVLAVMRETAIHATEGEPEGAADFQLCRLAVARTCEFVPSMIANVEGPLRAAKQRLATINGNPDVPGSGEIISQGRLLLDRSIDLATHDKNVTRLQAEAARLTAEIREYERFLEAFPAALSSELADAVEQYRDADLVDDLAAARSDLAQRACVGPTTAEIDLIAVQRRLASLQAETTLGRHLTALQGQLEATVDEEARQRREAALAEATDTVNRLKAGDHWSMMLVESLARTTREAFAPGFPERLQNSLLAALQTAGCSTAVRAIAPT